MHKLRPLRAPLFVNYEITRNCNLGCSFCSSGSPFGLHANPSWELVRQILDSLHKAEVFHLQWFGGEFTTIPWWHRAVEAAAERGFFMSFVSNGTRIKAEDAQFLAKSGIRGGAISLHGSAPVHDAIVQRPGGYERAMQGLRYCLDAGLQMNVLFTATASNAPYLEALAAELADVRLSITGIGVGRLCHAGEAKIEWERKRMTLDQFRAMFAAMRRIQKSYGIPTIMSDAFPRCLVPIRDWDLLGGCWQGTGFGQVSWNGDVKSCTMVEGIYGNLLKKPLIDIWTEHLAAMRSLEHLPLQCRICPVFCGGGCTASRCNVTHFAADELIPSPKEESFGTFARWLPWAAAVYVRSRTARLKEVVRTSRSSVPVTLSSMPRIVGRHRLRKDIEGYILYVDGQDIAIIDGRSADIVRHIDGRSTAAELAAWDARKTDSSLEVSLRFVNDLVEQLVSGGLVSV